jgi:hypothetical protein
MAATAMVATRSKLSSLFMIEIPLNQPLRRGSPFISLKDVFRRR